MTGSVQGRGEVLLEASNYEQIVGSFLVTRINGLCFNCEPSARARSPVSAEPDADTDDTPAAESDRLSRQVVRMTCSHSSLHRLKQYEQIHIWPANVVRRLSGMWVCVCARVCGLVCYEPEGAAENGASFRSAHVPVICLRGHRHKQHFEKVQAFVFLHVLHVFLNIELLTLTMCLCTPTLFEMLFCFPQLKLCFYVILINQSQLSSISITNENCVDLLNFNPSNVTFRWGKVGPRHNNEDLGSSGLMKRV